MECLKSSWKALSRLISTCNSHINYAVFYKQKGSFAESSFSYIILYGKASEQLKKRGRKISAQLQKPANLSHVRLFKYVLLYIINCAVKPFINIYHKIYYNNIKAFCQAHVIFYCAKISRKYRQNMINYKWGECYGKSL